MDCCPAETGCVTAPKLIKLEWLEPLGVAPLHRQTEDRCIMTAKVFLFLSPNFFSYFAILYCYYIVVTESCFSVY